jgi:hypothetical protein
MYHIYYWGDYGKVVFLAYFREIGKRFSHGFLYLGDLILVSILAKFLAITINSHSISDYSVFNSASTEGNGDIDRARVRTRDRTRDRDGITV